jgi:hypothetical protein
LRKSEKIRVQIRGNKWTVLMEKKSKFPHLTMNILIYLSAGGMRLMSIPYALIIQEWDY